MERNTYIAVYFLQGIILSDTHMWIQKCGFYNFFGWACNWTPLMVNSCFKLWYILWHIPYMFFLVCCFSGVLYLQYGDDSKQIRMPNEITSADTIKALFVSAFPHQLNMKMLESPSTAIYVKDENRNVYYELTDVRWVFASFEVHPQHSDRCNDNHT